MYVGVWLEPARAYSFDNKASLFESLGASPVFEWPDYILSLDANEGTAFLEVPVYLRDGIDLQPAKHMKGL